MAYGISYVHEGLTLRAPVQDETCPTCGLLVSGRSLEPADYCPTHPTWVDYDQAIEGVEPPAPYSICFCGGRIYHRDPADHECLSVM